MANTFTPKNNPLSKWLSRKNPKSYIQGLVPYREKQWQVAQQYFELAITEQPSHADSYFKLGMCHFRQKDYEQAEQFIQQAMQIEPERGEWKKQLEQTQRHLTKIEVKKTTAEKEESLRQQIEQHPNDASLYNQLAHNLRKQGKWWQEIEALNKAIELKAEYPTWHYRLGEALEVMNRFQQAAQAYGQAIILKNGKAEAQWYYRQGYCYEREGHDGAPNIQAASNAYKAAISKDDELNAKRFGIGVFHQARGHWQPAQQAYTEQFEQDPWDAELNYRLGMAYDRCYNWAEAERYYMQALTIQLEQPNWHYRLGFVLERQHKYEQAALAYEYAAKQRDTHTPYWFYRWGYVLEKQEKYQEAAQAYLQTRLQPTLDKPDNIVEEDALLEVELTQVGNSKPTDKNPLVDYEQQFNKQQFIVSALTQVLEKDTTNPQHWYQLGNAYERQQDWENAVDAYQHAVARKNEHIPEWYYRAGYTLTQLNNNKEASYYFQNTECLQKPYGVARDEYNNNSAFKNAANYTEYYEQEKIKKHSILFESFSGVSMSCNPYAIFKELLKDKKHQQWKFIWVVNNLSSIKSQHKKNKNIVFVKKGSDLYLRYLASCQYLINNSTFPAYFIRKNEQKYLNTWHGTPWKTLGKDIKNNFMEHRNTQRNFLHATHIISPNPHTSWVLKERYDIKGIYSGKFNETGYPRIDLTLNITEEEKKSLKDTLNINNDKKTILYAPTWRGTLGSPEAESEQLINEIKKLKELDINLIFRGHYFVENAIYEGSLNDIVVPEEINTNELLSIVDLLITDYSSIAFDFMVTDKPIIYYLYDIDSYKKERGLYFNEKSLPGEYASNSIELIELANNAIKTDCLHSNYKQAKETFTPHEDGKVSSRVVNWFFNKENIVTYTEINNKHNLLFFAGEFMPNGITVSFVNLINGIDTDKYNVTVVIDSDAVSKDPSRLELLERLPEETRIVGRVGRMNRTIEEAWVERSFNNTAQFNSDDFTSVFKRLYSREFNRVFGSANFDTVIEFSGYSRFWTALLGCADLNLHSKKIIYQHNDKHSEHTLRFPNLENTFQMYRFMDKIISVSEQTMKLNKDNLITRFNINESKFDYCENLHNPIEVVNKSKEFISHDDEEIFDNFEHVFITMGRLSPEKDQLKLVKSFYQLTQENKNIGLIILGQGPLEISIRSEINNLGLKEKVFLLGMRTNPFPLLKRASCFVLSSNHEGQPMVLIEAMILKKPIVSTDIVGSRSALEGRPGHLVDNSVEGLTEGMQDFLDNKLHFDEFDIDAYQENALNMFYEKVCGEGEVKR